MLLLAVWFRAANRIFLFYCIYLGIFFFAALDVHCGSRASLIIYWSRSTFFEGLGIIIDKIASGVKEAAYQNKYLKLQKLFPFDFIDRRLSELLEAAHVRVAIVSAHFST